MGRDLIFKIITTIIACLFFLYISALIPMYGKLALRITKCGQSTTGMCHLRRHPITLLVLLCNAGSFFFGLPTQSDSSVTTVL